MSDASDQSSDASSEGRISAMRDKLTHRAAALQERRSVNFLKAVLDRYTAAEGGTAAALMSIQLFTTVLPLIILGFAYLSGFADNMSVGVMFERQLGLDGSLVQYVRDAFGSADGLRSSWTFVGLAGFLI